jgi:hypothetical protein
MIVRKLACAAAIIAAATTLGTAAQACDQRFPWTCKPVPSIEPAEAAETKTSSKPLKITSRRATRAAKPSSRSAGEQSASTKRARLARKASARRTVRLRHARPAASARAADSAETTTVAAQRIGSEQPTERQTVTARAPRVAAGRSDPNSAFAMMWKDRTTVTAEPAELSRPAPAGEPAAQPLSTKPAAAGAPDPVPAKPVQVVAKDEANEIDLAAANPEAADSSWLRNLFLALGGLLAVGSAVRFLV